jgi:membrane protein DedA with SNARE-associated domain
MKQAQDWVTKGVWCFGLMLLGAVLVALTNSPVADAQLAGRNILAAYLGLLIVALILAWDVPKEQNNA